MARPLEALTFRGYSPPLFGAVTPPIVGVITAVRLLQISKDTRFVPIATPLSACEGFADWSFKFEKDSLPPFDRLPNLLGKARLNARLAASSTTLLETGSSA